jgi:dihydrofolate reductase
MINIIVATSNNGCIGKGGDLPWKLPRDLRWFKEKTMGKTIIMGRGTFDSIGNKPLPNRRNIVLTRGDKKWDGVETFSKLTDALDSTKGSEVFIIGGGEIYKQTMGLAARIYLTRVDVDIEDGDVFFPEMEESWDLIYSEYWGSDDKNPYSMEFQIWERDWIKHINKDGLDLVSLSSSYLSKHLKNQ